LKEEKKGKKDMKIDLEVQKEVAKVGMTATLGATVVTSMFMKNSVAKKVHVVAGVAFCGFALWHHTLYQSKKPKKIKKSQDIQETQEQKEPKIQLN
jgi:uncharacterized membrane protein